MSKSGLWEVGEKVFWASPDGQIEAKIVALWVDNSYIISYREKGKIAKRGVFSYELRDFEALKEETV
jgi:hypothetical protein